MNRQSAFIVTLSIPLSDGLDAMLRAIPQIDEVRALKTMDSALEQIESRKPRIVLIDAALLGPAPAELLREIQTRSPETRRVLLVDDVQELRWMPQYAEAVLIKGVSPTSVAAIVTHLLFSEGEEHERDNPN